MITDFRINERGELEGKVEMPQWNEMYTKDDLVAILTEIKDEIASNYLIDADTGVIISGTLPNFKAQKLLNSINNEIDKLKGEQK